MPSAISAVCVLIFAFLQGGPNFSGKWTISSGAARNGRPGGVTTLTIFQSDAGISGTLGGNGQGGGPGAASSQLYGLKVEGDTISFYVWQGSDQPTKRLYKGVMHDGQIDFTVTGGQGNFGGPPSNGQPATPPPPMIAKRAD